MVRIRHFKMKHSLCALHNQAFQIIYMQSQNWLLLKFYSKSLN